MTILEEPIKEPLQLKNCVDGEWIESEGELQDIVNPATGKVIGQVPISTGDELDEAVEAAREAFPRRRLNDGAHIPDRVGGALSLPAVGHMDDPPVAGVFALPLIPTGCWTSRRIGDDWLRRHPTPGSSWCRMPVTKCTIPIRTS